ncbi:hypothetical protein BP5796_03734 [Coleophoma crateriformis]|uniref:Rhodanese domain-containing protein n=1 Tax=Coleophoma crateriformis TaxID=565419 RepID=A0A3D8SGD0_9HELO|nr:hypothetical protein BP5796_03734 [Coleophoma crateriformis]
MSESNPFNVYHGEDSVRDYYDPDKQPMIPLVEIPRKLNPFYDDGVRIYAKMMSTLPANNVKALPALNMLQKTVTPETKTIIEYSSGSTVISMSLIARVLFGIEDTRAFLSNKTSFTKLQLMRFFGLNITLFGGPSQPEPTDNRGGIFRAEEMSKLNDGVINPNQYMNDLNWGAHVRWTGPQIIKQLPDIDVVCAGMGTAGTMTGIGTYMKSAKPSVTRVGVCTKAGDRVPGPRSYALMSPVEFPWRDAVDTIEEVGSYDSYKLSLELSREGLICGPSSGFNLKGLYNFLQKCKDEGRLQGLSSTNSTVNCVFICCDLPYQYLDDYFEKLGESPFHPLQNRNLLNVDKYRYDEAWEVPSTSALQELYSASAKELAGLLKVPAADAPELITPPGTPDEKDAPFPLQLCKDNILLDLRAFEDYARQYLPGAISMPLSTCGPETPSPFRNPQTLEAQWSELELALDALRLRGMKDCRVFVLCYNGDTARVATSVLRAKGIEASSIKGGMKGVRESCQ